MLGSYRRQVSISLLQRLSGGSIAIDTHAESLLRFGVLSTDTFFGASASALSPSGIVRMTAAQHAAETVLWPRLSKLMRDYPDITVELVTDEGLTDIVSECFDAGVRVGEFVEKDLNAVRIGPKMRQAIVGTLDDFKSRPLPKRPEDLTGHRCINLRRVTRGGYFPWGLEKRGRGLNVCRFPISSTCASSASSRSTAWNSHGAPHTDGLGLAHLPEDFGRRADHEKAR